MRINLPTHANLIGGRETLTVAAAELHNLLRPRPALQDWIKIQIQHCCFLQSRDHCNDEQYIDLQGKRVIEVRFALHAARQLAMVAGGERGLQLVRHIEMMEQTTGSQPVPARETEQPSTASGTAIVPTVIEGELRILDTDLAERLGFARPTEIRKLISRHAENLSKINVLATVSQTPGSRGGRPSEAYYLDRKQAIFVTAKSDAANAIDITIEIIERFDAYERAASNGMQLMAPSMLEEIGTVLLAALAKRDAALPALIEAAIANDPRIAVREFKASLQILQDAGVPPRGRRPFSRRVSSRLRRYCIATGRGSAIRESAETGRHLFQIDVVQDWLDAEGSRLIADHKATVLGQTVIPFGPKPL